MNEKKKYGSIFENLRGKEIQHTEHNSTIQNEVQTKRSEITIMCIWNIQPAHTINKQNKIVEKAQALTEKKHERVRSQRKKIHFPLHSN